MQAASTLDGAVLADGGADRARRIGAASAIVPQDGALFPHLTVAENIGFGLRAPGAATAQPAHRRADATWSGSTAACCARRPHQLSGGQQQRVALARALGRAAPADAARRAVLGARYRPARQHAQGGGARAAAGAGITTILVTHDQAEALSFADQVAVLREGRTGSQAGTPPRLSTCRPRDRDDRRVPGRGHPAEGAKPVWAGSTARWGACPPAPHGHRGQVEIMLRPEQLRFNTIDAVASDVICAGDSSTSSSVAQSAR